MRKLTDKQLEALHALAYPQSIPGQLFWAAARVRWQGPRRTLGSLEWRGLASYSNEDGWAITAEGRRVLDSEQKN